MHSRTCNSTSEGFRQRASKIHDVTVSDCLFAEAEMQCILGLFAKARTKFGLTISTKKLKLCTNQPQTHHTLSPSPQVMGKGSSLWTLDRYTCLDSTVSRVVRVDDEVNIGIARASTTFGRLRQNIWERRGTKMSTKLKVYAATILPSLLYTRKTWIVA